MRKIFVMLAVGTGVVALLGFTYGAAPGGAATGVDLGISGSVVAGVTTGQPGQELAFDFTTTNHSTTTAADLAVTFTITNGTADSSDYICPLISNHFDIFPDTPSCEIGSLGPGKTAHAAILATPSGSGTLTVKACASNLNGTTDPVPSNNCKTLTVAMPK